MFFLITQMYQVVTCNHDGQWVDTTYWPREYMKAIDLMCQMMKQWPERKYAIQKVTCFV